MIEKRPSYEEVNYTIRPAKCIERKMLAEAFSRLAAFGALESYRYIGFGSTYFTDFNLFHRALNFPDMVSIEKDAEKSGRFDFNRPFRCVTMKYGLSNEVLPRIEWSGRVIVWLDYDYPADRSVLADMKLFLSKAVTGSLLLVTVDARPDKLEPLPALDPALKTAEHRLHMLSERLGEENLPPGLDPRQLGDWGTAAAYWRVFDNYIQSTLQIRNGPLPQASRFHCKQLFHFRYADGARMLTMGWLLHDQGHENLYASCGFKDLFYVRSGSDPFEIRVPCLTVREVRALSAQLPREPGKQLVGPGIPEADLEKFAQIYRYFPSFAEAEL
jgi:hypothetical protein